MFTPQWHCCGLKMKQRIINCLPSTFVSASEDSIIKHDYLSRNNLIKFMFVKDRCVQIIYYIYSRLKINRRYRNYMSSTIAYSIIWYVHKPVTSTVLCMCNMIIGFCVYKRILSVLRGCRVSDKMFYVSNKSFFWSCRNSRIVHYNIRAWLWHSYYIIVDLFKQTVVNIIKLVCSYGLMDERESRDVSL